MACVWDLDQLSFVFTVSIYLSVSKHVNKAVARAWSMFRQQCVHWFVGITCDII